MKIEYRIPIDFSREKKRVTVVGYIHIVVALQ